MPERAGEQPRNIDYSLEIFPPRDPQKMEQHWRAVEVFCDLKPTFISVTCGAFGNAPSLTKETSLRVRALGGQPAVHLTCLGKNRNQMRAEILDYKHHDLMRVVALRGDYPRAERPKEQATEQLRYAVDLVHLLVDLGAFDISVAAYPEVHPEAPSPRQDLHHLKEKLDAGAARAITQFFFDPDVFLRFRDQAAAIGITKAIIPGILPILNITKVCTFAEKCQISIPPFLLRMYEQTTDNPLEQKLLAMNVLSHQVTKLMAEGINRFHFYTLNETLLNVHICRWLQEAF